MSPCRGDRQWHEGVYTIEETCVGEEVYCYLSHPRAESVNTLIFKGVHDVGSGVSTAVARKGSYAFEVFMCGPLVHTPVAGPVMIRFQWQAHLAMHAHQLLAQRKMLAATSAEARKEKVLETA